MAEEQTPPQETTLDAKMRPHISFSEWGMFRNICQHRWKLDYLEGSRSKIYSIHMDFGTAVHECLELSRSRKPTLTKEEAIPHFEKKFKELLKENLSNYREKEKTADQEFFFNAGRNILTRFDECQELAEAEVVYNEFPLQLPIERSDDIKIDFKGFVDMVIKTKDKRGNTILYVCDFKTCSWGWDREKRQDKELHFQILLYKHFICKKFSLDPKNVKTAFVLLKKRPPKQGSPVEFFPISAGLVSVQRALDELDRDITTMATAIDTGKFEKNRKSCVNAFGDRCPHMDSVRCPKD